MRLTIQQWVSRSVASKKDADTIARMMKAAGADQAAVTGKRGEWQALALMLPTGMAAFLANEAAAESKNH